MNVKTLDKYTFLERLGFCGSNSIKPLPFYSNGRKSSILNTTFIVKWVGASSCLVYWLKKNMHDSQQTIVYNTLTCVFCHRQLISIKNCRCWHPQLLQSFADFSTLIHGNARQMLEVLIITFIAKKKLELVILTFFLPHANEIVIKI